jgi:DNA-binding response OmpR family regulator
MSAAAGPVSRTEPSGVAAASGVSPRVCPVVLLVEDERTISEPFSAALGREGFEPILAGSLAEARSQLRAHAPDIVVLDLMLPDGDGRDLARELHAHTQLPVIILTARGGEIERVVGLELGADDYVVKPFSSAEVIARIRAVLRRGPRSGQDDSLTAGDLQIDLPARRAWLGDSELELTRKEFDLLARLVRSTGEVVTREALMSDVWDENWFGSTRTLDVHIAALRRKLGDTTARTSRIQTVRGVGFRYAPG